MQSAVFALIFLAVWGVLCADRRLLQALIDAIQNFRGGPPTAGHPLPSGVDAALPRRRDPD